MKKYLKLTLILLSVVLLGLAGVYGVMMMTQNGEGEDDPFVRDFTPFGNIDNTQTLIESGEGSGASTTSDDTSFENSFQNNTSNPKRLNTTPTTKSFVYDDTARYIDRQNGFVYDIDTQTGARTIISSTPLTGVFEAFWLDRDTVALHIQDEVSGRTVIAEIQESEQALLITQLGGGIESIAPTSNGFVYTRGNELVRVSPTGSTINTVTLPVAGWRVLTSDSRVFVFPKPSAGVPSALYEIVNGSLIKVADGTGLSAISDTVYSENASITAYNIQTIADKCAIDGEVLYCGVPLLPPQGLYPDDWYKGRVLFQDSLVTLNVTTENQNEIILENPIDITHITIAPNGSLITFINKRDGSLWLYETSR